MEVYNELNQVVQAGEGNPEKHNRAATNKKCWDEDQLFPYSDF